MGTMRQWGRWFLIPLVVAGWLVSQAGRSETLLRDSDTVALLAGIRERGNPWSWFGGDWPLFNHFYRPISTLSFELDNALYGDAAWGYGLTNALLAAACVLLTFWVAWELTQRGWVAGLSSGLLGAWMGAGFLGQVGLHWVPTLFFWAGLVSLLGVFRRGNAGAALLGAAACFLVWTWAIPYIPLHERIVAWLPGRTASVCAMFLLMGVAAYARFERLTAPGEGAARMPWDPPVSRGTAGVEVRLERRAAWGWLALAVVGLALALGAYEQAVVMPGLLLGVAVWMAVEGRRPLWAAQGAFWGVLVGYWLLRQAILPQEASGYQLQQFRSGPGVWMDVTSYLFPPASVWKNFLVMLETGVEGLFLGSFWTLLIVVVGVPLGMWAVSRERERWRFWGLWLMTAGAFLPMAWLKMFGHYHLIPSAFRAIGVVLIGAVALRLMVNAVSPRAVRAPERPDPAPGSLLRR